jgi:hypothetical protein
MKLEHLLEASQKRTAFAETRTPLEKELKNIFKLDVTFKPQSLGGTYSVSFTIPASMSADDIDFVAGMIKRKLPSLLKKHLDASNLEIDEPRLWMPNMKSMTLQNSQKVKMMQGEKELRFFVS